MATKTDLTGKYFGKWLVLERVSSKSRDRYIGWWCVCECGWIKTIDTTSLKSGQTKSCSKCCDRKQKSFDHLIGSIFTHLSVTGLSEQKNKRGSYNTVCVCLCDCGKETLVKPCNLISGRKKSCGCRMLKDLTGSKFASFTVIGEDVGNRSQGRMWLCRCECGIIRSYASSQVRSKKITSCLDCYNKAISKFEPVGEITRGHWSRISRNAELRGLPLEASCQFAWNLFLKQDRRCALSGEPLVFCSSARGSGNTASLDRIDSCLGYTETNIQWVHKEINTIKSNLSDSEFIQWCKKVSDWNQTRC